MGHWDVFMRKVEPIASRVPYQVTPGNHEFWFNFSAYNHRFVMPDEGTRPRVLSVHTHIHTYIHAYIHTRVIVQYTRGQYAVWYSSSYWLL